MHLYYSLNSPPPPNVHAGGGGGLTQTIFLHQCIFKNKNRHVYDKNGRPVTVAKEILTGGDNNSRHQFPSGSKLRVKNFDLKTLGGHTLPMPMSNNRPLNLPGQFIVRATHFHSEIGQSNSEIQKLLLFF